MTTRVVVEFEIASDNQDAVDAAVDTWLRSIRVSRYLVPGSWSYTSKVVK